MVTSSNSILFSKHFPQACMYTVHNMTNDLPACQLRTPVHADGNTRALYVSNILLLIITCSALRPIKTFSCVGQARTEKRQLLRTT